MVSLADFVNYVQKITQRDQTSEYVLINYCMHLLTTFTKDDVSNIFQDIDDYISSYEMNFAWYHQAIEGILIWSYPLPEQITPTLQPAIHLQ